MRTDDLQKRVDDLEAQLKASQERVRLLEQDVREKTTLLNYAPVAIQIFDADGLTVFMNQSQQRFLGVEDKSVAVGKFNVLTDPFTKAAGQLPNFQRAYEGEIVVVDDFEMDLAAANSSWDLKRDKAWFQQVLFPVKSADGRVRQVVSFISDVTERKEAESALVAAQRHEGMMAVAGGVAHDFNNLLTAIMGNASLGALDVDDPDNAKECFALIEEAAVHAAGLTRQMLAYAGRAPGVVGAVHMDALVDNQTRLLRASIPAQVELAVDIQAELPAVDGDEIQLRQVVLNLVTNAAQAIGDNVGTVRVECRALDATDDDLAASFDSPSLHAGRYVQLSVSDTGCGIAPDVRQRIFDPYFTTKKDGHGLGLAATLGIVQDHKGTLRVYSEESEGTTFRVLLPAVARAAQGWGRPASTRQAQGLRVLLVDDDDRVRAFAERTLKKAGHQVVAVENAEEAASAAQSTDVDLMLLDLFMPRTGSTDTRALLESLSPEVPVLLNSGAPKDDAVHRVVERSGPHSAAIVGFLQKPYTAQQLLDAVATATVDAGA